MNFLRRIICHYFGHPCEPTGRRGIGLIEYHCHRCHGVYIGHPDHGNMLIPAGPWSEQYLGDPKWQEIVRRAR